MSSAENLQSTVEENHISQNKAYRFLAQGQGLGLQDPTPRPKILALRPRPRLNIPAAHTTMYFFRSTAGYSSDKNWLDEEGQRTDNKLPIQGLQQVEETLYNEALN